MQEEHKGAFSPFHIFRIPFPPHLSSPFLQALGSPVLHPHRVCERWANAVNLWDPGAPHQSAYWLAWSFPSAPYTGHGLAGSVVPSCSQWQLILSGGPHLHMRSFQGLSEGGNQWTPYIAGFGGCHPSTPDPYWNSLKRKQETLYSVRVCSRHIPRSHYEQNNCIFKN